MKDQKNSAKQTSPFVGDPVACKFITFQIDGILWRMLCLEEGKDGSLYVRHLPRNSGRKITFHSNNGRGLPPYQRHHYGAGYHLIKESITYTPKFITDYKESPFCTFCWTGRNIDGESTDKVGPDDIVFNMDRFDFESCEFALFSDFRSDLVQSKCINAEGAMVSLKTLNLIASMLYRLRHKTPEESSPKH